MKHNAIFISGIDTGIGKTIVTGILARCFREKGLNVITQKFAQTGCKDISEDIIIHRKLMDIEILPCDKDGTSCPYVFEYASSPQLAAQLEGEVIDTNKIKMATDELRRTFDLVLIEGVGGLHVPITPEILLTHYISDHKYPLILVTSPRLGSINQTLMSLEICKKYDLNLIGIVYNLFPSDDKIILNDTREILTKYLKFWFPEAVMAEIAGTIQNDFSNPGLERLANKIMKLQ